MSVLSDVSLRHALDAEHLDIGPLDERAIQPASVDLRLGPLLLVPGPGQEVDLEIGQVPTQHMPINLAVGSWVLRPGQSVLGCTLEGIRLAPHLVGLLVGRSTLARLFLQVEAAGLLDPGYNGRPTLEITNHGPHRIRLYTGMPVAQLLVLELDTPAETPYGRGSLGSRYQSDVVPTPARAREASRE